MTGDRSRSRAEETKGDILAAARRLFASEGYERTTIRAVATIAGVDPALVMHYFSNKDTLFAAAARLDMPVPDLTGVDPARVVDALFPMFVAAWSSDGPMLSLLRAAASRPSAAEALRAMFTEVVTPTLAAVAVDRPSERAALIGSHLVGIAVARMIIGTPPLVAMEDDALIDWLRPVLVYYLTAPTPGRPFAGLPAS